MINDLQTNLGYFIMINYDSFSFCHLADIFFAMHAGAKELNHKRQCMFYHIIRLQPKCVVEITKRLYARGKNGLYFQNESPKISIL